MRFPAAVNNADDLMRLRLRRTQALLKIWFTGINDARSTEDIECRGRI